MGNVNCNKDLAETLVSGKDYYEIRLESIGGLGANLCGKMLGELGVKYLDLNSSSFSGYGSEKTGTPVKGYVRYCQKEKEIRLHSPIVNPDLLVVFHQALFSNPAILQGCTDNTKIIIATEAGTCEGEKDKNNDFKMEEICGKGVPLRGECYGVEAQKIAMETHSRINIVMLGAVLKIMGLEDISAGEKICKDTLGKKYPDALKGNLEGLKRGFEELYLIKKGNGEQEKNLRSDNAEHEMTSSQEPKWGYQNAPLGGINLQAGSSVLSDLSASRQGYIPIFLKEKCINCGLCFSTCPDMVFQFEKGTYNGKEMMVNQGLDYYHCKGCLRCVEICPVNALVRGEDRTHQKKTFFVSNKELRVVPEYYEKAGPDGYITSESYFTEKRMEGGEV